MHKHVAFQRTQLSETLVAGIASMRSIACMNPGVNVQLVLLREFPIAVWALKTNKKY
jgi:hypothetical protein